MGHHDLDRTLRHGGAAARRPGSGFSLPGVDGGSSHSRSTREAARRRLLLRPLPVRRRVGRPAERRRPRRTTGAQASSPSTRTPATSATPSTTWRRAHRRRGSSSPSSTTRRRRSPRPTAPHGRPRSFSSTASTASSTTGRRTRTTRIPGAPSPISAMRSRGPRGGPPAVQDEPAVGCTIKWRRCLFALHELKRFFAGRDRAGGALLGDEIEQAPDLRPRRDAELERRPRAEAARFGSATLAAERRRRGRSRRGRRARSAPTARSRAGNGGSRGASRPRAAPRPEQRAREPLDLVRDRKALDVLAEDDDEQVAGRVGDGRRGRDRSRLPPSGARRPSASARSNPSGERRSSSPTIRSPAGSPTRRCRRTSSSVASSSRSRARPRGGRPEEAAAGRPRRPDARRRADRFVDQVCPPPSGSTSSPPATGCAIALTREVARAEVVLDRPPRGVKSTVVPSLKATRQAPCFSESGKTAPFERPA